MISRPLFLRSSGPSGPRRHRAYAIGDVHGRLDLLESLLAAIDADIGSSRKSKVSIVFLGDLIDRGPESAQVIERLRTYKPGNATVHFIMGNHEEVMLRVLDGEGDLVDSWLRFGGAETLRSYGIEPRDLRRLDVEVTSNRIGIDTGAFCTGTLTALAIDGSGRWLIQTGEEGTRRVSLEEEFV